ncbi:MAG: PDZ domain-containing protein [Kiritimatiellaeota bacterium]|nr:PDZ domain-containing protein [Kiritimatiellota bacterium]
MRWIAAVEGARVRVAYTLMYADGEAPEVPGLTIRYLCENCGRYHTQGNDGERAVQEKRDVETWGWLVAPGTVLVQDAQIPRRFVKAVHVTQGEASVGAREAAYFRDRNGALLALDAPLPNAVPLAFSGNPAEESHLLAYSKSENEWHVAVTPYAPAFVVDETAGLQRVDGTDGIVLDASGAPIRVALAGASAFAAVPENYDRWETVSAAEDERIQERITAYHHASLRLATLHFRSPRNTGAVERYSSWRDDDDDDESAVQYAVACLLAPGRFLVLKSLPHHVTARLETIEIDDGEATFVASLAEFGAFIVETSDAASRPIPVSDTPSQAPLGTLMFNDNLSVAGGAWHSTLTRSRVTSYMEIVDGIRFPNDNTDGEAGFIYGSDGALRFLPIALRIGSEGSPSMPYPAARLRDIVAQLPEEALDTANVPRPASEENRIAWHGTELQNLTPELAIACNASHFYANNNRQGALVVFLHANSPAARSGIQVGDILLRLHLPRIPLPIAIGEHHDGDDGDWDEVWEHYDEIPAEYFDQLPTPWKRIDSPGNRALTSFIGKTCELEFVRDGKLRRVSFVVEESPPHHDSVERHAIADYGMTVCDLTFEVRRYFALADDALGILITHIEAGGAAAERGMRPYELITRVDDTPLAAAADLAALLAGKSEVRLTVKRMHKDRVVVLKPGKPAKSLLRKLLNL